MKVLFFHYMNPRNNYIMVHRGACSFCNFGNGLQNNILGNANGQWSKAFNNYEEAYLDAELIAQTMQGENTPINNCNNCNPM